MAKTQGRLKTRHRRAAAATFVGLAAGPAVRRHGDAGDADRAAAGRPARPGAAGARARPRAGAAARAQHRAVQHGGFGRSAADAVDRPATALPRRPRCWAICGSSGPAWSAAAARLAAGRGERRSRSARCWRRSSIARAARLRAERARLVGDWGSNRTRTISDPPPAAPDAWRAATADCDCSRRSAICAFIAFCSFSKARTSICRTRSREMPYCCDSSSSVVGLSFSRRSIRMCRSRSFSVLSALDSSALRPVSSSRSA